MKIQALIIYNYYNNNVQVCAVGERWRRRWWWLRCWWFYRVVQVWRPRERETRRILLAKTVTVWKRVRVCLCAWVRERKRERREVALFVLRNKLKHIRKINKTAAASAAVRATLRQCWFVLCTNTTKLSYINIAYTHTHREGIEKVYKSCS